MESAYTGNSLLDEVIDKSIAILFYGPAGVGKTTLLMHIAGNLCDKTECIYISTEETLHYEWVSRRLDRYEKALFTEAYDLDSLVKVSLATHTMEPRYIFIDSVNSLFRLEATKEDSLTEYTFALGLLIHTAFKTRGKVFASAQVRTGVDGGLEIPGQSILQYYFDNIMMIITKEHGRRSIKPIKTPFTIDIDHVDFKITDHGVEWIYEH